MATYLILGGTGAVGEGIAKHLCQNSHKVIVPCRNSNKEEKLREFIKCPELKTIQGNIRTIVDANVLKKKVFDRFGVPDFIIASLGGWWQGKKLTDMSFEEWEMIVTNNLSSHFMAAKVFAPPLIERGSGKYIMINGSAAENPTPFAGAVSMMSAAQKMMVKTLSAEYYDHSDIFKSIIIMTPIISRARTSGKPNWVTAELTGNFIELLASGKVKEEEDDKTIYHLYNAEQAKTGFLQKF